MIKDTFPSLMDQALIKRKELCARLEAEKTDAYRLFHGIAEGLPGLTIDRYGSLILIQTFREPLATEDLQFIEGILRSRLAFTFELAYNHRAKNAKQFFEEWHHPVPEALAEIQCREFGLNYLIRARHPGIDPWLFLDLRAGRRYVRQHANGKSVLNLFAYTCSVGLAAAAAGANEVWNVDFSSTNLGVGRRNAEMNGIPKSSFQTIEEDCLPTMRQLAGLPDLGRRDIKLNRKVKKFEAKQFDLVFLDPPAWSKGPFGAVDIEGDYPSLFKSAVLCAKPQGGRIIATHNLASVELETWLDVLKRCAAKAGRPIVSIETLAPEEDFPSFDGRYPLKIAICEV